MACITATRCLSRRALHSLAGEAATPVLLQAVLADAAVQAAGALTGRSSPLAPGSSEAGLHCHHEHVMATQRQDAVLQLKALLDGCGHKVPTR